MLLHGHSLVRCWHAHRFPASWITKEEQAREIKKGIKVSHQAGQKLNELVIESERLNLSLEEMLDIVTV